MGWCWSNGRDNWIIHSLRYLQFESRALPNLEPIPQGSHSFDSADIEYRDGTNSQGRAFQRSESTGSIADNEGAGLLGVRTTVAQPGVGKLPALLIPPKIAASLDNRELDLLVSSLN